MVGLGSSGAMQLVRAFTSCSAAMSVAPAVVAKSSGIGAIFGLGSSRIDTPLSQSIGVPAPLRSTLPTVPPKVESSIVEGVQVSSIDGVLPTSTIAVVMPGGSAYETEATAGASKVFEKLAFRATANRTTFRITRELEKLGASGSASVSRESMSFAIDATRLHVQEATEILLDSILNAKLNYWEVVEAVAAVKAELAKGPSTDTLLTDVLHRIAYDGGLGQPLVHDASVLDGMTDETIKEYADGLVKSSSMVLVGVGVSHGEFKSTAQSLLGGIAPAGAASSSTYVGGTANVLSSASATHIALAFEAKGGLSDTKVAALAALSQALLENSRSVLPYSSSKGPALSGLSCMYKSTGLVGVTGSAAPAGAAALVDAMCAKMESVAKGPSEAALKQAKASTLSAFRSALSTPSRAISVMGPQLLASGKFDSAEFAAAVSAVTSADVAAFASKALKSSPTLVSCGALSKMPSFDAISKRF